ncbi:MAG TPA: amidohydrolase family protein [Candidatus Saccharimonadales bacterium]|nr:amidohydrolase family protein [Candidatus Saccharimonadales bacterium]
MHIPTALLATCALFFSLLAAVAEDKVAAVQAQANQWRVEHRTIDLHMHIDGAEPRYRRALKIMDAAGLGIGINLSGGTVTPGTNGQPSEFERNKELVAKVCPGRVLLYMNLDYKNWDEPGFAQQAAQQVEKGFRLGAAGLKEYKRLGLYLKDGAGRLLRIDDPKLDLVWKRCGELGMPISIHVGDPDAFWRPFDEHNERWKELKDHKPWWFGDTNKFPPRMELLNALDRVIERHPETTFVCVHFANNPEDMDWVDKALRRRPNMMADLAARIPELGRHEPKRMNKLFTKYQDRILFATDFMVYDKLILGSSGDAERPTDRDAEIFYQKEWRWLETWDTNWEHMTPIQGDWTINSIGLPLPVLRKIYFDNARKLLARSMPPPVVKAAHITADFTADASLSNPDWQKAVPAHVEYGSLKYDARPELDTTVRVLYSDRYIYFGWECPFTKLTTFDKPHNGGERLGLWDKDVVEVFIGSDLKNIKHYAEYEVAPTNEKLDVLLNLPAKDFAWNGQCESTVMVDRKKKVFRVSMRMPISALTGTPPHAGDRWRLNLYRCDKANNGYLAWSPVLKGSFHTPEKFGVLEFAE